MCQVSIGPVGCHTHRHREGQSVSVRCRNKQAPDDHSTGTESVRSTNPHSGAAKPQQHQKQRQKQHRLFTDFAAKPAMKAARAVCVFSPVRPKLGSEAGLRQSEERVPGSVAQVLPLDEAESERRVSYLQEFAC
jgi:hypothetical protein